MSSFRDTYAHCHISSVGCSVGEIMDATLKELRTAMDDVLEKEKARITQEIIAGRETKSEPNQPEVKKKTKVDTPKRNAKEKKNAVESLLTSG